MHIVFPPKLNNPAFIKACNDFLAPRNLPVTAICLKSNIAPESIGGADTSLVLTTNDQNGFVLGSVQVKNFTNNCGMRTIGSFGNTPSFVTDDMKKMWLLHIEDIICQAGYSYVVSSDGSSTHWSIKNFIERYGVNWTVIALKENQRMSSPLIPHTLALMYKFLDRKKRPDLGEVHKLWQRLP